MSRPETEEERREFLSRLKAERHPKPRAVYPVHRCAECGEDRPHKLVCMVCHPEARP
jgi:hypothetical protein